MPDNARLNEGQSPLWGVVLCCTSIPPEQRSEMATVAQQMGAAHKLDLTSDVTHLIVGDIDTPKYKYVAKERQDIKVLQPAWLNAIRESWIQGEETDVAALERQFRLPTLSNLQICVTGFEDAVQRNDIQETVTINGANYHGDLTKAVTHLIAAAPTGKKYEYAGAWGIKIVTLQWLEDSLDRGMALDESLYHPLLPLEKRGKGAVSEKKMPSPRLGKHPRAEIQPVEPLGGSRRKLRRTASTRLESQNDGLWADIGSGEAPHVPTAKADTTTKGTFSDRDGNLQRRKPILSVDTGDNSACERPEKTYDAGDGRIFSKDSHPVQVFIYGFDRRKAKLLHGYLSDNGARVLSEAEMRKRIVESGKDSNKLTDNVKIVVPHDSEVSGLDELFDQSIASQNDVLVTEWWVEKCLHRKRLIDHEEEPLCLPFKTSSISGFETLTICPTSFSGIDLLLFSKLVKLMGADYDESLRRGTSVLVCYEASANPAKLRYALENKIPIVSAEWLYDSIRDGRVQPFGDYALSTTRQSQKSSQGCFFHPISNPRGTEEKYSSFKSKKDRPGVRAPLHRGRLDLTRHPEAGNPDRRANEQEQNSSSIRAGNGGTGNDVSRPLQSLSPSRQNTQQKDSPLDLPGEESHSGPGSREVEQQAEAGADAATKPNHNSLASLDSLRISRLEGKHSAHDSPHGPSEPSESDSAPVQAAGEPEPLPGTGKGHAQTLNTAIATLLAQQQRSNSHQSRPSSASASASASGPRPLRTLGRATSNGSATLSRTTSRDGHRGTAIDDTNQTKPGAVDQRFAADDETFDDDGERRPSRLGRESEARGGFRPSQALSYEDPEGAAVREKLMARLNADGGGGSGGGEVFGFDGQADGGMRVESIGVVKDTGLAADDNTKRRWMRRK